MNEVALIQSLQTLHNQFLLSFFEGLSRLGSGEFYILAIPLLYWCYHKKLAYRLGMVFLASMTLNLWLKAVIHRPRPLATEVQVLFAESAAGASFPSGHAQGSATFWGFLATRFHRRPYQMMAVGLVLLISLSRVFLGLHYPTDVLAGMAFGFGFVAAEEYLVRYQRINLALLIGVVGLLALAYRPAGEVIKLLGAMLGMGCGHLLTIRHNDFNEQALFRVQFYKIASGGLILGIIKVAGKYLLPPHVFAEGLIYFVLTFTAVYLIPYLFVRFGWSKLEQLLPCADPESS